MNAQEILRGTKLVPVVTIERAEQAGPLAIALQKAGITAIEITLRTDCALEAIERAVREDTGLVVGAGSVRSSDQLLAARDAGAEFCVSPGFTGTLLESAEKIQMPFVPGASTASEMLELYEQGYTFIKFFPAEINGGIAAINALSAPLPELRFFPTGGINAANIREYLAHTSVVCVGGSWFIDGKCLDDGDFMKLEQMARDALGLLH
jgi:2-dehydro-3-deoxyphosphogluconate aldolase/(4S)-4-hydroxy-2-oxoglutarate aldolase